MKIIINNWKLNKSAKQYVLYERKYNALYAKYNFESVASRVLDINNGVWKWLVFNLEDTNENRSILKGISDTLESAKKDCDEAISKHYPNIYLINDRIEFML